MRECRKCKEKKPIEAFGLARRNNDGLNINCKVCQQIGNRRASKKYYESDKEWKYFYNLEYNYGVTKQDYLKAFTDQNGECAICKTPQIALKKKLAVDHCHSTGLFRGLLCDFCNKGLGHFKDNKNLLNSAINYLDKVV